jgi:hypothetical protein
MKEHETRPTPETDAVADKAFNFLISNDGGIEAVAADFARKLERERDAMIEAIQEAHAALKELRSFYIEMTGLPPCAANAVLEKLKPFLP